MIVLKHLARDINWDPHRLRKVLRHIFGKVKGHRWKWESLADPRYLKVKASVLSHNGISKLPPAHVSRKTRRPSRASSPSPTSKNATSTKRRSS